jgi:hypothetical protein
MKVSLGNDLQKSKSSTMIFVLVSSLVIGLILYAKPPKHHKKHPIFHSFPPLSVASNVSSPPSYLYIFFPKCSSPGV